MATLKFSGSAARDGVRTTLICRLPERTQGGERCCRCRNDRKPASSAYPPVKHRYPHSQTWPFLQPASRQALATTGFSPGMHCNVGRNTTVPRIADFGGDVVTNAQSQYQQGFERNQTAGDTVGDVVTRPPIVTLIDLIDCRRGDIPAGAMHGNSVFAQTNAPRRRHRGGRHDASE